MTSSMTKQLESFTRGGQVWRHELAMALANITALGTAGIAAAGIGATVVAKLAAGDAFPLYWRYNLARLADTVGLGDASVLAIQRYTPSAFVEHFGKAYHAEFMLTTPLAVLSGIGLAGAVLALAYRKFLRRDALFKDKHLRGKKVLSQQELIDFMREHNAKTMSNYDNLPPEKRPGQYILCGVPMPAGMLQRNILLTGVQGSGKTVALFLLLDQVAKLGRTMIIYDRTGEFTQEYYRGPESGDIILNPFDARSHSVNVFAQFNLNAKGQPEITDFEAAAATMIPISDEIAKSPAGFFYDGARTLVMSTLMACWAANKRTMPDFVRVMFGPIEDLAEFLEGTPGASMISGSGNSGGDVLKTAQNLLKIWRYEKAKPGREINFKKFVQDECDNPGKGRRIFIQGIAEFEALLMPYANYCLGQLYAAWLNADRVQYERVVFSIDEAQSAGPISKLEAALTQARKFGVVTILGFQNVAQIIATYGKHAAQTIMSNLQSYILLRVSDADTAELYSRQIGVEELDKQSDSISFGAAEQRDSGTINVQSKENRLVLPSELQSLPDMSGYLQLAGAIPVAHVSFSYRDREPKPKDWQPAPDFVRADLHVDLTTLIKKAPKPDGDEPKKGAKRVATISTKAMLGLD